MIEKFMALYAGHIAGLGEAREMFRHDMLLFMTIRMMFLKGFGMAKTVANLILTAREAGQCPGLFTTSNCQIRRKIYSSICILLRRDRVQWVLSGTSWIFIPERCV